MSNKFNLSELKELFAKDPDAMVGINGLHPATKNRVLNHTTDYPWLVLEGKEYVTSVGATESGGSHLGEANVLTPEVAVTDDISDTAIQYGDGVLLHESFSDVLGDSVSIADGSPEPLLAILETALTESNWWVPVDSLHVLKPILSSIESLLGRLKIVDGTMGMEFPQLQLSVK
jgi:hypothetical protein